MPNYQSIKVYDEARITSHSLYIKNIEEIKKLGLNTFLHYNGVFGGVVPHALPPVGNSELVTYTGYGYEMEYRTTIKNEDEWNMENYREHKAEGVSEKDATTNFILKAFEIIQKWNINNIEIK